MARGIGIYIGRKHVVAALAVGVGNSFKLKQFAVEPIVELTTEEMNAADAAKHHAPEATAIHNALGKIGVKKTFAKVSISPFHVVTRHFIMPPLPAKEKPDAIRYEASRFTKMKITESVFAYRENISANKIISVTANAVKKRMIQSVVVNLQRAGANPLSIEPDYLPFSRACKQSGLENNETPYGFVWMDGDSSVNISLVSKGNVFFSQDFRLTGDVDHNSSKLHDELLGSFRYLKENASAAQIEQLYIAGFGEVDSWSEFIQQKFPEIQIHVIRPQTDKEESGGTSAAVLAFGLALGALGMKSPLGDVSVLPPEYKKMTPPQFLVALGAIAGLIAIIFCIGYFFVQMPILNSLEGKKRVAELPLSGFGPQASMPIEDLNARAGALEGKYNRLSEFERSLFSLKSTFVAIVKIMPKAFWLQSIVLENNTQKTNNTKLVLQGYCYLGEADKEAKRVNEWTQSLVKDPVFSKKFGHLAVDEIKQQKFMGKSMTHFTITAEA